MTHLRAFIPVALLSLAWPAASHARVVEKIAALVGDDIILMSEVEDRAAPLLAEIASIANPSERETRAAAVRREVLERLIASFAEAAAENGVAVVAGDTKVVRRGEGGGVYLTVAGIGVKRARAPLAIQGIEPGDAVLVSGPVGDHGIAVMLAREQFGLSGELRSDSASVLPLARAVRDLPGLRFMRDPTRGGLATVAHEIARACGHSVALDQSAVPLRPEVVSVCEMLGYDPYFLACEGRIVAVADVFDALTSRRPYKDAWSIDDAFAYLKLVAGEKLDRDCVQVLVENREVVERIQAQFAEDPLG